MSKNFYQSYLELVEDEDFYEDESLSDGSSHDQVEKLGHPIPELEFLKITDQNHIKFVLNIPMFVPVEDLDGFSSDTEEDETFGEAQFNFDLDNYASFPYRTFDIINKVGISKAKKTLGKEIKKQIINNRVGALSENVTDEPFVQDKLTENVSKTNKLLESLAADGFNTTQTDYLNNLGVSVGLNRFHSLSTRKNEWLKKELHSKENNSSILYNKTAFFWDVPWTDVNGNNAEYDNVKKFYKQLKKRDLEKAEKFLKINEESYRPSPPYQYIREHLKNHENTKELVQTLRADNGEVLYFSSIDSDTMNFNHIFSSYLKIIAKSSGLPTVMSTGYEFAEDYEGFPLHVGSKLERIIRIVTAKTLSSGVYYPEPNFCVLIPSDQETLPYSFIAEKVASATLESPVLLRQVLKSPDRIWIFSKDNPIVTSGDRAKKQAREDKIVFSEEFENGEAPNEKDLNNLSQIIQSTANPRDWALGVYYNRCFKIKGNTGLFNKYITQLFKGKNISKTLDELGKMVKPIAMVDKLYQAVNNVKFIKDAFYRPFEQSRILDEDQYMKILAEFYNLSSKNILKLTKIINTAEIYRALNANYSLSDILCMTNESFEKFNLIFSKQSKAICQRFEDTTEEVTYEDLERIFDRIFVITRNTRDFEELISDNDRMFSGEYGALNFNEIFSYFIACLESAISNLESQSYEEDDSYDHQDYEAYTAYNLTVNHFANDFEAENRDDYSNDEKGSSSDIGEYPPELLIYPEGSYENFNREIMGYYGKFKELLPSTNFVAAANNLPGYRNEILEKLATLTQTLNIRKDDLEKSTSVASTIPVFNSLYQFSEIYALCQTNLTSDEKEYIKINNLIADIEGLQDLLSYSLQSFPDNPEVSLSGENVGY